MSQLQAHLTKIQLFPREQAVNPCSPRGGGGEEISAGHPAAGAAAGDPGGDAGVRSPEEEEERECVSECER